MKKIWSAPEAVAEQFAANEYVAACYLVKCDVPSGRGLYNESNGVPGLQMESNGDTPADERLLWKIGLSGCNRYHGGVIRATDPETNGYWVSQNWGGSYDVISVFWWHEDLGSTYDYHASASLEFETNPNAS